MKRILISAAIVSMMLANCTDKELVDQATDGRMFTLEVSRGMDSRTTLTPATGGYQTLWSEGDQIYVTSEDGGTTGVLALVSSPGSANGTFQGYVFGEGELKYTVFPVPVNGVIDLNNLDEGEVDAPMIATIDSQGVTQFKNACALINLNIDGLPQDAEISVSGDGIVSSAAFNAKTGSLAPITTSAKKVAIESSEESVLVPLFINPTATDTEFDLTISVNGKICDIENIPLKNEKVSSNNVPELQYTTVGDQDYLVEIVEPSENGNVNEVLATGASVVISSDEAVEELTIGQSDNNVPTVITFEYPISEITIKKDGEVAPTQPIKVIVAGGVTEEVEVRAEDLNIELVYQVNEAGQMSTLLTNLVDAGSGNTSVEIAADIDLTGETWEAKKVDGYHGADIITVDGKYHTITGLTRSLFAGGFAGGSGIVIKNLTIAESTIVADNTQGYGAFVGCADSMDEITLINCHLIDSSIITPNDGANESRIGGLIGWTAGYNNQNDGPVDSYITVTNCSVTGCTLKGAGSIGGIVGHAGANAATFTTIENCTIKKNVFISTDDGGWRTGVVVGTANNGQCEISNIIESENTLKQENASDVKNPTGNKRNYYGRFVPAGTGSLTIDETEIK